jgi:hypothetical protein
MRPKQRNLVDLADIQGQQLSVAAQTADWRAKLEAELPTSSPEEAINKIYFAAGRYSAGHRDSVATAAWLAIGEELL